MLRSVPQLVSALALIVGVALFAITIIRSGFDETIASASRLGFAFPALLLPGACWHLLRTWGWSVAFPDDARPGFSRLLSSATRRRRDQLLHDPRCHRRAAQGDAALRPVAAAGRRRRHHTRATRVRDRVARHRGHRFNGRRQTAGDARGVGRRLHAALDGERSSRWRSSRRSHAIVRATISAGSSRDSGDSSAGRSKRRASSASCWTSRMCCSICCAAIAAG